MTITGTRHAGGGVKNLISLNGFPIAMTELFLKNMYVAVAPHQKGD
jgi:hypothetical protein